MPKTLTVDPAGAVLVREVTGGKDERGVDRARSWSFTDLSQADKHAPMFAAEFAAPVIAPKLAALRVAGKAESDAIDAGRVAADAARSSG